MQKTQTQASAPVVAPILQAPPVAAAAVTTATADDDILSLFSSALETPSKKAEAPKAFESEQPKASTFDLRAKRVEEVAKREREEAEKVSEGCHCRVATCVGVLRIIPSCPSEVR